MSLGIAKTLATFSDIQKLAVDAIDIVKVGGFRLSVIPKIVDAMTEVNALIQDAPEALPELQDLDMQEASQVGGAAYSLVKAIITAIVA